jgi:hypothetical protein
MLAEVIKRRLAAVTGADRTVLEAIALCGQLPALGLDTAALTRLGSCGLIEIRADERRIAAVVAHPLYAEAVGGGMPLLQRRDRLVQQADRLRATGMRRRMPVAAGHVVA